MDRGAREAMDISSGDGWDPSPYHLLVCGVVTACMQGLFFLIAATLRFDIVTDLAGGGNVTFVTGTRNYEITSTSAPYPQRQCERFG